MKGNVTLSKNVLIEKTKLSVKKSTIQQLLNYSKSLEISDSKSVKKVEWVLN